MSEKTVQNRPTVVQAQRVNLPLSVTTPVHAIHALHPKPEGVACDVHFGLELGIILAGQMERIWENHRHTLQPGECWMCGMWEPHGWRVQATPCEAVVLVALPQMLAQMRFDEAAYFRPMSLFLIDAAQRPRGTARDRHELLRLGRRIADIAAQECSAWSTLRLRLLLIELLVALASKHPVEDATAVSSADSYPRISRAVELVFNERAFITVEQAAKTCHMHTKTFHRLFQNVMGVSFAKFAIRYRLDGAASQLRLTDDPIKAVARNWGFIDNSHFHHHFVRYFGCTPMMYRSRHPDTG